MTIKTLGRALVAAMALFCGSVAAGEPVAGDRLLRLGYESAATGHRREYFVFLPVGYRQEAGREWPVMLFLHGNGERGDGLDDLDYVLAHGPLMEAWIQRRPLPFIIISPQLPVFGELDAIADRKTEKPARLDHGAPERNYGFPSTLPIQRTGPDAFPDGPHANYDPFSEPQQLPAGWERIDTELIAMVDHVLDEFRTDPSRVYLTGLSMGGFGAFHMATRFPDRWAAMAAIVATGRPEHAGTLADAGLPIWMFGGGKDTIVKPHWLYTMARALEEAEHPALRFTMHEDMDHDAWKRVYAGHDLYDWFLRYRSDERPARREKSQ
ncbi:MAG: alpha/beta hydrolase-fold protein [Woeseia sp.]